jgi:hypothetical protein
MALQEWRGYFLYGCLSGRKRSGNISVSLIIVSIPTSLMNCSVQSAPIEGNSFTNSYPDWENGTNQLFLEWAKTQFGLKQRDPDESVEVPVRFKKAKEIEFTKNRQGEFILHPLSNYRRIKDKQRVVRGYIGAVYRA